MLTKSARLSDLEKYLSVQKRIKAAMAEKPASHDDINLAEDLSKQLGLDNTLAAAQAALWDEGKASGGYLGAFAARGNIEQINGKSWANSPPAADLTLERADSFDLDKSLQFAAIFDGDIDGLTGTGSSSIKEGEERFVQGASYVGTRGVAINETSGLLANYVRGKRITWTDGGIWVRQVGGEMNKTDISADEFDSRMETKNDITFFRHAGKNFRITTKGDEDINYTHIAKGKLETSISAATQVTTTATGATTTVAATVASTALAASVLQTSVSMSASQLGVNVSGCMLAYNASSMRIVVDSTLLTAQISQNNFFNVARNSLETYVTAAKKYGGKVEVSDVEAKSTGMQLIKTLMSVVRNNAAVISGVTSIVDKKLSVITTQADITSSQIHLTEKEGEVQKVHTTLKFHGMNITI